MKHLFVIPGHGAGDSGACGGGYTEAERVRSLALRIKHFGGNDVTLADFRRNYYADNGIMNLNIPKDWQIIELHMDAASASARGGHVIIQEGFKPDEYDRALGSFIGSFLPGRYASIIPRNNLANPRRAAARGYGYRLVEFGFITNAEDRKLVNSNMDYIAKNVLRCFGIGDNSGAKPAKPNTVKPVSRPKKTVDAIARDVINGKYGNGAERVAKIKAEGANPSAVQARVNEILGVKAKTKTPPKKSIDAVARDVINGKYGNGSERSKRLKMAGYSPSAVQAKVNALLGVKAVKTPKKSVDAVARDVIGGKYGNGAERERRLRRAGYNPLEVQRRVNQLLR